MNETEQPPFLERSVDIVSAYVKNNSVPSSDLPSLIASVHQALQALGSPREAEPEKPEPAIAIKKSVTPDFLFSLEDGKRYKSLKRHLTGRGLTPDQYRAKWGLPNDYPMVAANYAKQRSELAKSTGLGQLRRTKNEAAAEQPVAQAETAAPSKPARRRPRKAAA